MEVTEASVDIDYQESASTPTTVDDSLTTTQPNVSEQGETWGSRIQLK